MSNIRPIKSWKIDLDKSDDLPVSQSFLYPDKGHGACTYLCGHSLGLQPKLAESFIKEQLNNWHSLGVEGHFKGNSPWITYVDPLNQVMAAIVGARSSEVVIMNSLTANIHLLLSGFYRPRGLRTKILMEFPAFPSDIYAIRSHLQVRGYADHLLFWKPNEQTGFFEIDDLERNLHEANDTVSLIFLSGLHYLSGQLLDIEKITKLAHRYDIAVGFDLAHAAGNVSLDLHQWGVDFACWCTYKYLNGGPGSMGAIFIHEIHHDLQEHFQGWWGNSLENRFEMKPDFTPALGASGWQLSNPPIMALAPLKASLEIFQQVGMERVRQKSMLLTGYLEMLLFDLEDGTFQVKTPTDPNRRGAMLCLQFRKASEQIFMAIEQQMIIVDYRKPDTLRVAPHPLYNSYQDCFRFVEALKRALMEVKEGSI